MQVWMQTVNLAFTENSVYTTRQIPSNDRVGTFLNAPLPSYYLLSCLLLLSVGHVGGDADLGISIQHMRMAGQSHLALPHLSSLFGSLESVPDADLELSEQCACLMLARWCCCIALSITVTST